MKLYIKSNTESKPIRELKIAIDIIAIVQEYSIAASEEPFNLPIADKKIAENIETEYDEIVDAIDGILFGQGFTMVEHHKSNQDDSNSMYFIFCRETEYEIEQVELLVGLRVSDHDLRHWQGDKSDAEAKNRMRKKLQEYADDVKDVLNPNLSEDENIDTAMIFVKYENEFYSTYGDMLRKVKDKIRDFKRKYN